MEMVEAEILGTNNRKRHPPRPSSVTPEGGRRAAHLYDSRQTAKDMREEKIRDGDYVYSVGWQGVYFVSKPSFP